MEYLLEAKAWIACVAAWKRLARKMETGEVIGPLHVILTNCDLCKKFSVTIRTINIKPGRSPDDTDTVVELACSDDETRDIRGTFLISSAKPYSIRIGADAQLKPLFLTEDLNN